MKKNIFFLVLMLMLVHMGQNCQAEDNPGKNDLREYFAWWQVVDGQNKLFSHLHIYLKQGLTYNTEPTAYSSYSNDIGDIIVIAYDIYGDIVDKGFMIRDYVYVDNDYNETIVRMQIIMENIGQFSVTDVAPIEGVTSPDQAKQVVVEFGTIDFREMFEKQRKSPVFVQKPSSNNAFLKAIDVLAKALGKKMEGKALMAVGEERIEGVISKKFKFGENRAERFVTESHFAVNPNGKIFILDMEGHWTEYSLNP